MNELELIARLTAKLPLNDSVLAGAGDDCAVLDLGIPGRVVLFKTDAVVEGVHFTRADDPKQVGHKALARALSDIAAMAGEPGPAVVTLGLPKDYEPGYVEGIYAGMTALAQRFGVAIVGGETTANPGGILISIALLGFGAPDKIVYRRGARAGDAIFVSGELGGSLAGKHLEFEPRLTEACWLTQHFKIHSLIDLSDGLASDLRHLLNASQAGAELLAKAVPVSRAAKLRSRTEPKASPPLQAALTDGEDFELLFTVSAKDAVRLHDTWKKQFPKLKLSCIGKVVAGAGITLLDRNSSVKLEAHGYVHLA